MEKHLLIFGGGSTALEIREVVDKYFKSDFDKVLNVIGNYEKDCPYSFIRDENLEATNKAQLHYIVSFSDFKLREQIIKNMKKINAIPIRIVHPKAEVAVSAQLGLNIYIAANAVISSFSKIGDNVIINYNSVIGHDAKIGDNTIINPMAKISGNSTIGQNVLIGAGAFVFQGVEIGDNTLIDAMSYIDRNIESNKICSSKSLKIFNRVI